MQLELLGGWVSITLRPGGFHESSTQTGRVPHETRDEIVDYVNRWRERAELPAKRLLGWMELGTSEFHNWKERYGKAKPKR